MNIALERKVGLGGATALNMVEMIGVGPFITIPLIIQAMGGPQAILGWGLGALFALCDGLVWAELGASFPRAGGSYEYLKEIYGPHWGRFMGFLYVWQLSVSAPLSIASGCVGLASYAAYLWPSLSQNNISHTFDWNLPLAGQFHTEIALGGTSLIAMGTCILAVYICYRRIDKVAAISKFLWAGVMLTVGWVILTGLSHFHAATAFDFPPNAFHLDTAFWHGLGAATLIATYDYWGYYNVNFFGGEVQSPEKSIPRSIVISIIAVASLYITMNICLLGVLPWRSLASAAASDSRNYTVSIMMQTIYGPAWGKFAALLVMWTAFASVASVMVGASRVPYAAAQSGDYFRLFRHIHPQRRFPDFALLGLGATAIVFCLFRLRDLIAALVVIRILVQFLAQNIGVIVLRQRRPTLPRPFRMWLYPLPALLATCGFVFILIERPNALKELLYGAIVIALGSVAYVVMNRTRHALPA